MKPNYRLFLCATLMLFYVTQSHAIDLPQHAPVPGGIALVPLPETLKSPSAYFNKRRVMVIKKEQQWLAVVGLPLAAKPGTATLSYRDGNQKKQQIAFSIESKTYKSQYITLKNKRMVNPEKRDMTRIGNEQKRIRSAFANWDDTTPNSIRMNLPVTAPVSSPFGLRRFFNKQPRKPHSGLDLAAPQGTPIQAPAAGKVTETGDFFFNGNTVFIDHGQGLVSMYCHMHQIDVSPGQTVKTGDIIGTVGKTGRVTGAHLHWSMSLNNTRIDPVLFLGESDSTQIEQ